MTPLPYWTAVGGGALATGLLLLAAPAPAGALRHLRGPGPGEDVTAPLVALSSLIAWLLALWLLVTVALTAGAHLPGRGGRTARAAARRTAPATVRRAVEVALGLSVVVGVVGAPPAAATAGADPGAAAPSLDWGAPVPGPDLDWAAAPATGPAPEPTEPQHVVVQPGDSLWSIAESDLARATGSAPSGSDVASAWPAWWAANRATVGDDPDLITPGTRLSPPDDSPASS